MELFDGINRIYLKTKIKNQNAKLQIKVHKILSQRGHRGRGWE